MSNTELVVGCYRWRELEQLVGREGGEEEEERQRPAGKERIMISFKTLNMRIYLDLGWIFSKDVVNRLYPHHDVLSPRRVQLI